MTLGGQFVQYTQIAEMIREQWKKIGIDLQVQEVERSLAIKRAAANEQQLAAWNNDGSEHLFTFPAHVFPFEVDAVASSGPLYAKWFRSGGTQGKEPEPRMKELMEKWKKAFGVPEKERDPARQGRLEDRGRGGLHHRRGRPGPGGHGRARREEQHGQHPVAHVQQPGRQDAGHLAAGHVLLEELTALGRRGSRT